MRRMVAMILGVLLCAVFGSARQTDDAVPHEADARVVWKYVADSGAEQRACAVECNNDPRLPVPETFSAERGGGSVVARATSRRPGGERVKLLAPAVPDRRAGHVTSIFEFDIYRSSLCAGYYLHALRRLRI